MRDSILNKTPLDPEIIRVYYQWNPVRVKVMEKDEEFKEELKEMIDGILEMIEE